MISEKKWLFVVISSVVVLQGYVEEQLRRLQLSVPVRNDHRP
jgi:hypothetical protein